MRDAASDETADTSRQGRRGVYGEADEELKAD